MGPNQVDTVVVVVVVVVGVVVVVVVVVVAVAVRHLNSHPMSVAWGPILIVRGHAQDYFWGHVLGHPGVSGSVNPVSVFRRGSSVDLCLLCTLGVDVVAVVVLAVVTPLVLVRVPAVLASRSEAIH